MGCELRGEVRRAVALGEIRLRYFTGGVQGIRYVAFRHYCIGSCRLKQAGLGMLVGLLEGIVSLAGKTVVSKSRRQTSLH